MNKEGQDRLAALLFDTEGTQVKHLMLLPGHGNPTEKQLREEAASALAQARAPGAEMHSGFEEGHYATVNVAEWAQTA